MNILRAISLGSAVLLAALARAAPPAGVDPLLAAATEPAPEAIVDCLFPGQIRKVGRMVYQTPPRPATTTALKCDIQGGDYLVYDRANFESSLAWWVQASEQGDANAMRYVGEIFEKGFGREPDFAAAAVWYQKAADAGNIPAMISLAQLYKDGRGVARDPEKARQLYASAFGTGITVELDPRTIEPPEGELQALVTEIETLRANADTVEQQLAAARQQLAAAREALAQQEQASQSSEEALRRRDEIIERLRAEIQRAEREEQRHSETLGELTSQEAELQALRRAVEQERAQSNQLTELLAAKEKELAAAQATLDQQTAAFQADRSEALREALAGQREATEKLRDQTAQLRAEMTASERKQQETIDALRAAVEQRTQALAELEGKLVSANGQLDAALENLTVQRTRADSLERELKATRDERLESASALEDKDRELARLQADIDRLRGEVTRLGQESEGYRIKIQALETPADIVGPAIVILKPEIEIRETRGVSLVPAVASDDREVAGRVTAPAGLLEVTINGIPMDVDDNGVFRTRIRVDAANKDVRIVAVDLQKKRAEKSFTFDLEAGPDTHRPRERLKVAFGNYHALLIGNQSYEEFPDLKTPVDDVKALDGVLTSRYGFRTTVLVDARRDQILTALSSMLDTLTSQDNLLIYYAGHGTYVEKVNGYAWLPVDAELKSPARYFWNDDLTRYLSLINAKQILVMADSCYSGAITRDAIPNLRGGLTPEEYEHFLKQYSAKPARIALTSGGYRPVLDGGGGSHSVFARAVLEVLGDNDKVLASRDLAELVAAKVSFAADRQEFEQEPEVAPIGHSGHQGGEFFLVPKGVAFAHRVERTPVATLALAAPGGAQWQWSVDVTRREGLANAFLGLYGSGTSGLSPSGAFAR